MNKILVFSAPMAGVSDYPFRVVLRHFGNQFLFSEMIGVETLIHAHPKTLKMMTFNKEKNIIVQLVGANPAHMAKAAQIVEQMGVAGIDINMGCPVKKLIQNHSGAMLMQDQDLALKIVEAVKNAVKIPVSVKTRLGWHNPSDILNFAPQLASAGADRLEIHARTKEQGYQGVPDWSILSKLNLDIPYIVNGDIVSHIDAKQALIKSKASSVMIGRALLGHPWKLQEIETGKKVPVMMTELILEHLDLLLTHYGHAGLFVARKHLAWYAAHKKGVAKWRQKMYCEEDENKLKQMILDFWEE